MQQLLQFVITKINIHQVKHILTWALLIAILYQLAQLTWSIVERFIAPENVIEKPINIAVNNKSTQRNSDIRAVTKLHLFGEANAQAVIVAPQKEIESDVEDAQETSLNIKLKGVFATDNEKLASAVIEHSGNDAVYSIGDKLPGGPNIILKKVEPFRIVFKRNGNNEFLELEAYALDIGEKDTPNRGGLRAASELKPIRGEQKRRVLDKRRNTQITKKLQELRGQFQQKGPESFKDLVSVSPVQSRDGLEGYRVSPGKDRRLFTQFGFNRGDIITELNGIALNDPSRIFEVADILGNAQNLSVVIKRGSSEVELQFSLQSMQQPEMLDDRTKTKM
jgi:general secretion pathway protein C